MKRYLVYLLVLALFTVTISAIDMEKERDVRKSGWYIPEFQKYKKVEIKRFRIKDISEEFIIQYYVLKEQYKDELFQIEMKLSPKDELRKYRIENYGIIKLVTNNGIKKIAYEYSLFDIGDLVGEEGDKYKYYDGGSAILPIIILDLDEDSIYESCWDVLKWSQNGFIDRKIEIIKYKYKKMMEKKGLKKSKKDGC